LCAKLLTTAVILFVSTTTTHGWSQTAETPEAAASSASEPADAASEPSSPASNSQGNLSPAPVASAPVAPAPVASAPSGAEENILSTAEQIARKIEARATDLRQTLAARDLKLRERRVLREMERTEMHASVLGALAASRGESFAVTKEYIYSNADILLFGCFALRPFFSEQQLFNPNRQVRIGARATSVFCGLLDVNTILIPFQLALLREKSSTVVFEALYGRQNLTWKRAGQTVTTKEPLKYPIASRLLRTALLLEVALIATEQTLALTHADEIDYRDHLAT
jgi:hypothetical protein